MTTTVCPKDLDSMTTLQTPTSLDFKDLAGNMAGQETVDPVSDNTHSTFDTQSIGSSSSRSPSEEAADNAHVDSPEAHPDGLYDPKGYYKNVRVQGRIVKERGRNHEDGFHTDNFGNTKFMPFDYIDEQDGMDHGSEYDNMQAHQGGRAPMVETIPEYEDDGDQDADGEDDDESMFIPEISTRLPNRIEKSRSGHRATGARRIARQGSPTDSIQDHPAVARRRSNHGKLGFEFSTPNTNLAPSRYSGAKMPWGVNQQPVMTDQETVSDASLLKRGITRPPKGDKVCKRSYGANDPENIAIVNMKENMDLTFQEIVDVLNEKRVKAGKDPKLTICGVNGRYNRTAPIMFAAQGLHFVPLSERKKYRSGHGKRTTKVVWNPEDDEALVETVKHVDTEKWTRVADTLNRELRGGRQVYDAESCAKRYAAL
ncbi:hypothetical protein CJF31_00008883 [Rutstroemia sp. NJR-2017a BVV2]|nr:hypothetical protein CJF31_00008883 [Rutstroemia sp. NJR-2017a BVV2]